MTRRGYPKVELFLEKANDFVSCSPDEEIGKLTNLVRNIFEPVLVFEGNKFIGLISIQNIVHNVRMSYMSKAINNIAIDTLVKKSDNIIKIIKRMRDYGWYRVPVFDNSGNVIGQLSAKNLLKTLVQDNTFLRLLILKTVIRNPVLVSQNDKIEDVIEILRDKDNSYMFLIDDRGNYTGAINKSSLIKAFNKDVESKRFSVKSDSTANNIYVGEKIDRNDYPLRRYIKRRTYWSSANESDSKEIIIKKLIGSRFHTIAILNKDMVPVGILETKDLLEAILIKDKTGFLPLKIDGFDKVSNPDMNFISLEISELYRFFNKKGAVNKIELTNKEVKSPEGKLNLYELKLKVDCYSGKIYIANVKSRDLRQGIRLLINKIKKQMR
jgi:predicted transcriptional regulator